MPKSTTIDAYEIEICGDSAVVKYGKFSATLDDLEASGHLISKSGRTHFIPSWVVYKLASAARALAEA